MKTEDFSKFFYIMYMLSSYFDIYIKKKAVCSEICVLLKRR